MNMRESEFQKTIKRKIKDRFPDSIILKNDPNCVQGVPDLLVLWQDKWAALECKRSQKASHRPNQEYYVNKMNEMAFASFIFPENVGEVLDAMEQSFKRGT